MNDDVHVYPSGDRYNGKLHKLSRRCWCEPKIEWPCDECMGDKECWRCHGKMLTTQTGCAAVVTHNAQDKERFK